MRESFPNPTERTALDRYAAWQCTRPLLTKPILASSLDGGSTHLSCKLTARTATGDAHFVLRYRNPKQDRLGISFAAELTCLQRAADAGLAPRVVWHNIKDELIVMDYAAPEEVDRPDLLAELVMAIHKLPPDIPALDLKLQMARYTRAATDRGIDKTLLIPTMEPRLSSAIEVLHSGPQVLCHNDLTLDNIRYLQDRLIAIDWEYAAVGSPYFDIAALCAGRSMFDATAFARRVFDSAFLPPLWQAANRVYNAMSWNWHWAAGLVPGGVFNQDALTAQRDHLLHSLGSPV